VEPNRDLPDGTLIGGVGRDEDGHPEQWFAIDAATGLDALIGEVG